MDLHTKSIARLTSAVFVSLGLLASAGVLYAWSAPPSGTPPNCPGGSAGCDAPINVSNNFQSKDGNLMVNAGGSYATGFSVPFGNVGIGTASPGGLLNLSNTGTIQLWVSDSDAAAGLKNRYIQNSNGVMYFGKASDAFDTPSDHMVIDSAGNVGIGTTGPASRLDLQGGDLNVSGQGRFKGWFTQGTGLAAEIGISSGQAYIYSYDRTANAYQPVNLSGSTVALGHSGSQSDLFISTSGGVGIGTTATPAGNGNLTLYLPNNKYMAAINTTGSTAYPLIGLNASNVVSIDRDGLTTVFGGNISAPSFTYTSDLSLKKDVRTIPNALEKVLGLRGVEFTWQKDNTPSVGVIAQEVEKVFPELVSVDKTTGLKGVEYGNLVGPLIEAVKEQQKAINAQQKMIEELQKEVAALKASR